MASTRPSIGGRIAVFIGLVGGSLTVLIRVLDWMDRGDAIMKLPENVPQWIEILTHPLVGLMIIVGSIVWLAHVTRKTSETPVLIWEDRSAVPSAFSAVKFTVWGVAVGTVLATGLWVWLRCFQLPGAGDIAKLAPEPIPYSSTAPLVEANPSPDSPRSTKTRSPPKKWPNGFTREKKLDITKQEQSTSSPNYQPNGLAKPNEPEESIQTLTVEIGMSGKVKTGAQTLSKEDASAAFGFVSEIVIRGPEGQVILRSEDRTSYGRIDGSHQLITYRYRLDGRTSIPDEWNWGLLYGKPISTLRHFATLEFHAERSSLADIEVIKSIEWTVVLNSVHSASGERAIDDKIPPDRAWGQRYSVSVSLKPLYERLFTHP